MAVVPQVFVSCSRTMQPLAALAMICATLPVAGCVHTFLPWHAKKVDVPVDPVALMTVQWKRHVLFAPDPVHNGQPVPALAARIYFFGPDVSYPVKAHGDVNVKLYIPSPQPGQPGRLLEEWNIDYATLEGKLARKDMVGWGYTLLLPWSTYNPSIRDIELVVCYKPKKGAPIYKRSRVRLRDSVPQLQIQRRVETAPGGVQPPSPVVPPSQNGNHGSQPPAPPQLLPAPTPLPGSGSTPRPSDRSGSTQQPQRSTPPTVSKSQQVPSPSAGVTAPAPRASQPRPDRPNESSYPRTLRLRVENGRFVRQP